MSLKYTIPRGTYDILPTESYKWNFIKDAFREVATSYNFKEILTPIFERAELFERSVGGTSDIVQKEMYKFSDKKGRIFALRPEGTASIVRSFVQNNLDKTESNVKLYYMGPMFRYDRPQKGRYRQFYQYGVEYLGPNDPYTDAEVISIAYNFLKRLGLKNFNLEINSIGNPTSSQNYDKALVEYFSPHKNELCPDCKIRLEKNPKRILDCKVPSCKEIASGVPSMLDYLDEESAKQFELVQKYLTIMKIPYKINPKIVRGLDYYTNTAFEIINNSLGAQNAILGGGRYDGLTKQIGGRDVPGIGFAGGFERLILSMEQEGLSFGKKSKLNFYFVAIGEKAKEKAVEIVNDLRTNGINVEYYVEKNSIKSQMKAANKLNVNKTLILGEEELNENKINIKNMETGEQIKVSIDNLVSELKR